MLLLNNQPVSYFTFSGGEIQIKLPEYIPSFRALLTWKPISAADILLLQLTVNALKYKGISDIDLDVLYLPYARQDRVCAPGEANSLEVICGIINNLDVSVVRLWDVHNEQKTVKLLDNPLVVTIGAHHIFDRYKILDDFDLYNTILCAPDHGACPRVDKINVHYDLGNLIILDKTRDASTGSITGIKFNDYNRDIADWNIFVIDDICDGGATFIEAAKILKEQGAAKLFLYVTHGIFSRGLNELLEHYEHIYCHHVLHDHKFKSNEQLTIITEFPNDSESIISN